MTESAVDYDAIIIGAGFYIFLREQRLGRESEGLTPPPA